MKARSTFNSNSTFFSFPSLYARINQDQGSCGYGYIPRSSFPFALTGAPVRSQKLASRLVTYSFVHVPGFGDPAKSSFALCFAISSCARAGHVYQRVRSMLRDHVHRYSKCEPTPQPVLRFCPPRRGSGNRYCNRSILIARSIANLYEPARAAFSPMQVLSSG